MANVNATVTGTLINGSEALVTSAVVKAQRVDAHPALASVLNTDDTIEATSNSSTGIFSLTLPVREAVGVTYKITLS